MEQLRVYSVDDDKMVHRFIDKALKNQFSLEYAYSGKQCLEEIEAVNPNIILLDVEMPEMNGYEVCSHLKENPLTAHIPVIFLSGLTDLQSRVSGFDAGGSDFLVKPFDERELKSKLSTIQSFIKTEESLRRQVKEASDTAYQAMQGTSELGISISFIEASFQAKDINALARSVMDALDRLELRANLMLTSHGRSSFFSNTTLNIPPLEEELMGIIHAKGQRFTDFGSRTQINYNHAALLVKNMPIGSDDKYGRYKDLLPTLVGLMDSKMLSIETENALIRQTQNLTESFDAVRDTLSNIGSRIKGNQNQVVSLLKDMLNELDHRIPTLGLEDDQEYYLLNRLDTTVVAAQNIIDNSEETSLAFNTVTRLLEHLIDKQNEMLAELYDRDQAPEPENREQKSKPASGVDLF